MHILKTVCVIAFKQNYIDQQIAFHELIWIALEPFSRNILYNLHKYYNNHDNLAIQFAK